MFVTILQSVLASLAYTRIWEFLYVVNVCSGQYYIPC